MCQKWHPCKLSNFFLHLYLKNLDLFHLFIHKLDKHGGYQIKIFDQKQE